jgi:cytochrome c biogenesis protein CcmG/thiol:disulfide interchange protein DsbE
MQLHRLCTILIALTLSASTCLPVHAQTTQPSDAAAPATAPATAPSVTPAARALLDQVRDAYAAVQSLDVAGTLTFDADVAGKQENHKVAFTGSFAAPNKFRHQMEDDLLIVADGDKAFAYKIDEKKYLPLEIPKERAAAGELPDIVGMNLQEQNPSLLYVIVKDAAEQIGAGAESVDRGPDVTIDGKSYPALNFDVEGEHLKLAFDPATHLVRQLSVDMKDSIAKQGVPMAKKALVTVDYTRTATDAKLPDATFAWAPPADATLFKPSGGGEGTEDVAANALVGKPAPAFATKDLQGGDVSLAALKGNVVVLDFWATWCPPCRESLPPLSQLEKDMAPKGVKVFAVNQGESKDVARKFITEQKLTVPVLLDESQKIGEAYKVEGIPQTVVIGKDGKVQKVFVGFGPTSEQELREAIQSAMSGG